MTTTPITATQARRNNRQAGARKKEAAKKRSPHGPRAASLFAAVGIGLLLFISGLAIGNGAEAASMTFRLMAGSLLASLLILVAAVIAARATIARLSEARKVQNETRRVLEKVEGLLEKVTCDHQAAERLQLKGAESLMPSGRELQAAAPKLPYPKGWYEEDFDPF